MSPYRRVRSTVVLIVILVCLAVVVNLSGIRLLLFGSRVIDDALVGQREELIREEYGTPVSEEQGYRRLAAVPQHREIGQSVKTLIFSPNGLRHLEGGTLWVWLSHRDGTWRCFQSCWYADNIKF